MDLGLERAGMTCVAQVEIDPWCQRILEKHWPDVPKYGDIRDVGKHNLPAAQLIAGGFPCQPHSVAGKRKGADDDRNLWPEYFRIIKEMRPAWVVGENVPGIITTYLDTVLSDLEGAGYEVGVFNLPACGFDAPHRRERIFIVGYPHCTGLEEQWGIVSDGEEYEAPERAGRWAIEPGVDRVVDGVPNRVDRVKGLGNAVVPQVAEFIGKYILETDRLI